MKNRTRGSSLKNEFLRKSGSETHGSLLTEPSMKRLGAKSDQISRGLPHVEKRAMGGSVGCEVKKAAGGNWIKNSIKKPGALHKTLGVPENKKIPEKMLERAEHSKNPTTRKRAILAETLKSFRNR